MKNIFKQVILLLAYLSSATVWCQSDLSISTQLYPTGIIPGLQLDQVIGENEAILFRIGYQFIDHRDLGVHDDEQGNGYGLTVGYKKYLHESPQKLYWAIKSDLWFNAIDWYDIEVNDNRIIGSTDITVLQPTAELGYQFLFPSDFFINPSIAFGWEWNIKTDGEPTGQGAILLIGLQLGKRF